MACAEFLAKDIALSVLIAWAAAQVVLKIIVFSWKKKKLFLKAPFLSGGMPSGHSALVAALSTAIYINQGFTPLFIVTLILAALIIYDVLIKKRVIAGFLTVLAEKHPKKHLLDELGHGIKEVLVGVLIGMVGVLIYFYY
jgi:acid phosphatase family membrane protein YuiD